MGFKSKFVGAFAATALSVGLVAGAAAQQVDEQEVPANLTTVDSIDCYVNVTGSTDELTFGQWRWDGVANAYVHYEYDDVEDEWAPAGPAVDSIDLEVGVSRYDQGGAGNGCTLEVATDGLDTSGTMQQPTEIGPEYFAIEISGADSSTPGTGEGTTAQFDQGSDDVSVTVTVAALPVVIDGSYTGDFTFTVSATSD